ncbi:MAG: nitrate reductase molybdenum cofactor assembly chaperone [Piscirickettsiaceae bacterium]|nr:MAG: nitrate reductase molybdenum cofactor assembly chaperone [Piscirickettsiaceae bacterium]PCI71576.1 MAG: nitrate reductase molybdenum cofactor assembly chaperone [Piscirickettsiaceae bacterium]
MLILKVISRLLDYPSKELADNSVELVEAVNASHLSDANKAELSAFINTLAATDLYDAQERYDLLFERGRSLSLLLFEHVHGESRDRGQAMVDLMAEYAEHGFDVHTEQMPDYIPLYLEFLSLQSDAYVHEWLGDVSHILTVLSERLLDRECDYRILFESLIEISGVQVEREKIAESVRKEEADYTMEAIDKAWEDKEIRFDDPIEGDCQSSCGGGYAASVTPETPVTWSKTQVKPAA